MSTEQAVSPWLLTFSDRASEAAFRAERKKLHRPLERASLVEPFIYLGLALKTWKSEAYLLTAAKLLIAGCLALKCFLALARPHANPSWRDTLVGVLHPLQLLCCSLLIQHSYVPVCEPTLAFWAAQFVVSSLPWLVLAPLTNGLLFRHLLVVQAAAVAAVVATVRIRCGLCAAACAAAGPEQFRGAAEFMTQVSSPFLPTMVGLSPRAACYSVFWLKQISLGYFLVLWLKYRWEIQNRHYFAVQQGLRDEARELEVIVDWQGGPWGGMGAFFVASITWHGIILVVHE